MSDPIKISVIRKSQPVSLEVSEGEEILIYIKEMTGAQRDDYFNRMAARTKLDEKGEIVGVKDYKGLYSGLLSLCTYAADGKPVPEKEIQDWPDTAQKQLFELARDLNNLVREGDSKN
jgi:hypothetical protein